MLKIYRRVLARGARVMFALPVALVSGLVLAGPAAAAGTGGFTLPKFSPTQPPDTADVSLLFGYLQWGGLALCVAGVMIAGATMAISHRNGRGGEHAASLGWIAGGAILLGGASGLIGTLA